MPAPQALLPQLRPRDGDAREPALSPHPQAHAPTPHSPGAKPPRSAGSQAPPRQKGTARKGTCGAQGRPSDQFPKRRPNPRKSPSKRLRSPQPRYRLGTGHREAIHCPCVGVGTRPLPRRKEQAQESPRSREHSQGSHQKAGSRGSAWSARTPANAEHRSP